MEARETPLTPDSVALGPGPSLSQQPLWAPSAFVLFLQAGSPAEPFSLSWIHRPQPQLQPGALCTGQLRAHLASGKLPLALQVPFATETKGSPSSALVKINEPSAQRESASAGPSP